LYLFIYIFVGELIHWACC